MNRKEWDLTQNISLDVTQEKNIVHDVVKSMQHENPIVVTHVDYENDIRGGRSRNQSYDFDEHEMYITPSVEDDGFELG